jgi:hypothetical protein
LFDKTLLVSSSGHDVPLMVYNWFTRVISIVRPQGLGRVALMMCIADICERAVSFGDEILWEEFYIRRSFITTKNSERSHSLGERVLRGTMARRRSQ